ncbi:MAG: chorismate-binding protein [Pseudobdellovibrio sp.]
MDKQSNINDLLNSNLLELFSRQGGLLQISQDEFIVFIGSKVDDLEGYSDQMLVYCPDYWDFLSKKGFRTSKYPQSMCVNRAQFLDFLKIRLHRNCTNALEFKSAKKEEFKAQFDWSQEKFKQGQLQKTVPMTYFEYAFEDDFDYLSQLDKALTQQSFGYIYGEWNSDEGYLGLTPETLATWDGQTFKTMALAGTWGKDINYRQVADVDVKTREEHEFVIKDIHARIHGLTQGETYIYKMPVINHLKTELSKDCKQRDLFLEYAFCLHPTAALGYYPRDLNRGLELMNLPLQNQREKFGAPFGLIADKFAFIVVGIRNFKWNLRLKNVCIRVGCGVTAQSVFEDEWKELVNKKTAIQKAFGLELKNESLMI